MRSQAVRGAAWVRPDGGLVGCRCVLTDSAQTRARRDLRFAALLSKKTLARFDAVAVEGSWTRL
jgi:hypothetical protein